MDGGGLVKGERLSRELDVDGKACMAEDVFDSVRARGAATMEEAADSVRARGIGAGADEASEVLDCVMCKV